MQLINETTPRGFYGGAIALSAFNGEPESCYYDPFVLSKKNTGGFTSGRRAGVVAASKC